MNLWPDLDCGHQLLESQLASGLTRLRNLDTHTAKSGFSSGMRVSCTAHCSLLPCTLFVVGAMTIIDLSVKENAACRVAWRTKHAPQDLALVRHLLSFVSESVLSSVRSLLQCARSLKFSSKFRSQPSWAVCTSTWGPHGDFSLYWLSSPRSPLHSSQAGKMAKSTPPCAIGSCHALVSSAIHSTSTADIYSGNRGCLVESLALQQEMVCCFDSLKCV